MTDEKTQVAVAVEVEDVDVDDLELKAAQAELEAETKPKSEDEGQEKKPGEQSEGDEAKPDEKDEGEEEAEVEAEKVAGKATPMIPKPRFDEINAAKAELEKSNAYLDAQVKALEKILQSTKATPAQKEAAVEKVASAAEDAREAIEQSILKAADRYDENEITMAEYKKIEIEANKQLAKMDRDGLLKEVSASRQDGGLDLFAEQMIDMLEEQHPYAKIIDNQKRWDFLAVEAVELLLAEGVQLGPDPKSEMRVRQRAAELTDKYGPLWYPDADIPQRQSSQQAPGKKTDPAPKTAPSDRDKKLTLAGKFPPDTRTLGSAGTMEDMPSEQKLEGMSDEEIGALPKAVRDKILNQL